MKITHVGHIEKSGLIRLGSIQEVVLTPLSKSSDDGKTGLHFSFLYSYIKGYTPIEVDYCLPVPSPEDTLIFQQTHPINIVTYMTKSDTHPRSFIATKNSYLAWFLFNNYVLQIETNSLIDISDEHAILHLKKFIYTQNSIIKKLHQEVKALESIVSQNHKPKRTPIPDAVKMIVYERDEGKCVRCGSTIRLHFDHIIPFSKGGADSEDNIQILCEVCNLQKSDKIAF